VCCHDVVKAIARGAMKCILCGAILVSGFGDASDHTAERSFDDDTPTQAVTPVSGSTSAAFQRRVIPIRVRLAFGQHASRAACAHRHSADADFG
jgi:hypothetical protein